MQDTLVFDIETQNFFTDPGVGWNNYDALKISVVGVYSYARGEYFCFGEHEMEEMAKLFRAASRLVGFSMNRYDVPVLHKYFLGGIATRDVDLWKKDRFDILEEIEAATGARISLSKLAHANLGIGKDMHGADAIALYRDGLIDELKKYCLKDVELTKTLYDLYRAKGVFLIPNRETGEVATVRFPARPAVLF